MGLVDIFIVVLSLYFALLSYITFILVSELRRFIIDIRKKEQEKVSISDIKNNDKGGVE